MYGVTKYNGFIVNREYNVNLNYTKPDSYLNGGTMEFILLHGEMLISVMGNGYCGVWQNRGLQELLCFPKPCVNGIGKRR